MISDSELSDEFSLDTVGSHGDVKCKGKYKDYLVRFCYTFWHSDINCFLSFIYRITCFGGISLFVTKAGFVIKEVYDYHCLLCFLSDLRSVWRLKQAVSVWPALWPLCPFTCWSTEPNTPSSYARRGRTAGLRHVQNRSEPSQILLTSLFLYTFFGILVNYTGPKDHVLRSCRPIWHSLTHGYWGTVQSVGV